MQDGAAPTWLEALALADRQLQCGAKTRAGTPCKRKGIGRGGRCVKHAGMSTGPRTPEGMDAMRAARREYVKTQPRVRGRWAKRTDG